MVMCRCGVGKMWKFSVVAVVIKIISVLFGVVLFTLSLEIEENIYEGRRDVWFY